MKSRRILLSVALGLALTGLVTALIVANRPDDACACSFEPTVREPALATARAFHRAVTGTDPVGAWQLLGPAVQARYGNVAGFAPIADRLRAAYADPASAQWFVLEERIRFDAPSEAAVVLYGTSPPRFIAAVIVQLRWGATDPQARVDPEPARVDPVAVPDGRHSLRVELPPVDGSPPPPKFLALDTTGVVSQPYRQPAPSATTPHAMRITAPAGLVVVIYAG